MADKVGCDTQLPVRVRMDMEITRHERETIECEECGPGTKRAAGIERAARQRVSRSLARLAAAAWLLAIAAAAYAFARTTTSDVELASEAIDAVNAADMMAGDDPPPPPPPPPPLPRDPR